MLNPSQLLSPCLHPRLHRSRGDGKTTTTTSGQNTGPSSGGGSRSQSSSQSKAGVKGKHTASIQLHLDLGQKDFNLVRCARCGMVYAPGDAGDERLHREHHAAQESVLNFQASLNECRNQHPALHAHVSSMLEPRGHPGSAVVVVGTIYLHPSICIHLSCIPSICTGVTYLAGLLLRPGLRLRLGRLLQVSLPLRLGHLGLLGMPVFCHPAALCLCLAGFSGCLPWSTFSSDFTKLLCMLVWS